MIQISFRLLRQERFWVMFLMRGGLTLSGALLIAGMWLLHREGPPQMTSLNVLHLFQGGLGWGEFCLSAGIFVLALIPALRVGLLLLWWGFEGDWRFVGVAALVIFTLVLSYAMGGH